MKKILMIGAILAMAFLTLSLVEAAAFVKYDGIDGESKDSKHDKWIDVSSVDWGMSKPGSAGLHRSVGVKSDDIVITKTLDKATPKILEAIANGRHIENVILELDSSSSNSTNSQPYLRYELKNVLITSYSTHAAGDGIPIEEISMNFEEIKVEYAQYDETGGKAGVFEFLWNFFKGK